MTAPLPPNPEVTDPRSLPDFVPAWFPTADGAIELITPDPRNAEASRRFQCAYYAINRAYARLRGVRETSPAPDRPRLERQALQEIETALRHRDELEDSLAPLGIIAEPEASDGYTVDIQFTFGSTDASGRYRSEPIITAAEITLEVPPSRGRGDLRPPGFGAQPNPCAD